MNQNGDMVDFIMSVDAETDVLKREANIRYKEPAKLDFPEAFLKKLDHIWEAASVKTQTDQRLREIIDNDEVNVNKQTYIGKNSPLHFAVVHENI